MTNPQDKNRKNSKQKVTEVPAPVDYEYWKKMPSWTIKEAIYLLFAIDPIQPELRTQQEGQEILKIIPLIDRAIEAGELECHSNIGFDPYNPYQGGEDFPVNPKAFIKWALEKDLDVPGALRELSDTPGKKLRPSTKDKLKCQEIAQEVWKEYPLDYKYMMMHPEIKIVGKNYTPRRVREWLSEVADKKIKRKGTRSKDYEKEQLVFCKKLNIEVPKK